MVCCENSYLVFFIVGGASERFAVKIQRFVEMMVHVVGYEERRWMCILRFHYVRNLLEEKVMVNCKFN